MENSINTNFDEEFTISVQKKFLALMIFDQSWAQLNGLEIIKPECFNNTYLQRVCRFIHEYHKQYQSIPTKTALCEMNQNFINKMSLPTADYYACDKIIQEIFNTETKDLEYFKEEAVKFVRQTAWKKALEKGGSVLKYGNYDEALDAFRQVLNISSDNDLGLSLGDTSSEEAYALFEEANDPNNMIKTGIAGWDRALGGGFAKSNLHIIAAPPAGGKSVSVETPVLTPTGWKRAGDIKLGDTLISRKGLPTKVLGVYPQGVISNYKVVLSDLSETNCCENHLWSVYDTEQSQSNEPQVLSLKQILEKGLAKSYIDKNIDARWKLPLVEPVQFDAKKQTIPAYDMGVSIAKNAELEVKSISEEYLFGSVEQRIELLHGLMDSAGYIHDNNTYFSSVSKRLAEQVIELVQSLGGIAYIKTQSLNEYNVFVALNNICPFGLSEKVNAWHPVNEGRYIKEVIKQEDVESVCFKVDNDESLFVIEHYIVTHNTKMMSFLARNAILDSKRVVYITLEMTQDEIIRGIISSCIGMSQEELLTPAARQEYSEKYIRFQNMFHPELHVKFFMPGTTNADKVYNYIQRLCLNRKEMTRIDWKPDVIFLDYMDKMIPTQKVKGNLYEDVGGIANDCKNLAIKFDCPVITGSQLGKLSWSLKGEEVVSMDSIAESAQKVHLAHSMTTINLNANEKKANLARLFLAKSRNGLGGETIYVERDLARCLVREVPRWNQGDLETAEYFVKSSNGATTR